MPDQRPPPDTMSYVGVAIEDSAAPHAIMVVETADTALMIAYLRAIIERLESKAALH